MAVPEASLLRQLAANSDPYRDPLVALDWSRLSTGEYWLPETALSLYGTPEFDALCATARMRLSQYEFIALAQSGIALGRLFLRSTAARLERTTSEAEYAYLLHEMREEAGHSLMFLRLIAESGLRAPDGRTSVPGAASLVSRSLGAELPYWFAMVVAEDVPDRFNRFVRRESATPVCPLVRQIVTLHAIDEARHLAYAKRRLESAVEGRSRIALRFATPLLDRLFNRFVRTYFWPRAEIYELAGLGRGATWRDLALRNPVRRRAVARLVAPTLRFLAGLGIVTALR